MVRVFTDPGHEVVRFLGPLSPFPIPLMPLMTLLIVTADDLPALAAGQALQVRLQAAGLPVLAAVPCHMLVRETVRLAPEVIVVWADSADSADPAATAALWSALALLAVATPKPVLVLGGDRLPDAAAALIDAHVMAWLPSPLQLATLHAALALAVPRFAHEQRLRQDLQGALARLDERKWVDRAKGVLMRHQQLSEEDAFSLLRAASMQANLRVGEVSRGVIEAASAADAVNRAGQLRMLSQRCVKALALRAASGSRQRADDGLAETLQRLQANLDHLAALPLAGPAAALLTGSRNAWLALVKVAGMSDTGVGPAGRMVMPTAAVLQQADQLAEVLLEQADALTAALEHASGRRSLSLINLCGRQRMLSQRLAKQALLAGLLGEDAGAAQANAAAMTVHDFETTLLTLEQAPLATDAIRATLAQARGQWQRLLDGLRRAAGPDAAAGRGALARESEALLASFEALTSLYEHSMQVLLG